MRRFLLVSAVVMTAFLLPAGWANAQNDRYSDDDDEYDYDRFALGVGIGLVEPLDEVEPYFMASLRIRAGGRGDDSDRRRGGEEGISGWIEPEIGYWETSDDDSRAGGSDLLAGINLIGVVPLGNVDSFFGVGAGVHWIDATLVENDPFLTGTDTKFGANAQFGLDLFMTDHLSAFGAGRFDLVQGTADKVQTKVYLGIRGRF
jgi:hypothetical protein